MCKSILKGQNVPGTDGTYHGTDGTHTRGCPAKILYVYWFFFFPQKRKETEENGRKGKKIGSDTVPATPFAKSQFGNRRPMFLADCALRFPDNRLPAGASESPQSCALLAHLARLRLGTDDARAALLQNTRRPWRH